jgi:uncharacterized alkaline shock family protein YloU
MLQQITNEMGTIDITDQAISVLAGSAALEVYGLVGMASRQQLKDGIADMLGRGNLAKGVEVWRDEDQLLNIDLYIIVSFGTRISEVAQNVQQKVQYVLAGILGLQIDRVNIYVKGVRVSG